MNRHAKTLGELADFIEDILVEFPDLDKTEVLVEQSFRATSQSRVFDLDVCRDGVVLQVWATPVEDENSPSLF